MQWVAHYLEQASQSERLAIEAILCLQTVVVDYSAQDLAKEWCGSLRATYRDAVTKTLRIYGQ